MKDRVKFQLKIFFIIFDTCSSCVFWIILVPNDSPKSEEFTTIKTNTKKSEITEKSSKAKSQNTPTKKWKQTKIDRCERNFGNKSFRK